MDVAPCITLQSDMANLFDQYLFKDHSNYEVSSTSSNLVASEGYNSMAQQHHNFSGEDFNFQGLQLPPPPQQNHNGSAMMTSNNSIHDNDHSLADIFTSPILSNMSHSEAPEVVSGNQYNSYVSSCESSYPCPQNYGPLPIYTTSELKPPSNCGPSPQPILTNVAQSIERGAMRSPQQQSMYTTMNQGHMSNNHSMHQQRFNGTDRRPSSTGSVSVGSSPAESIHTSPGRESEDSDDSVPLTKQVNGAFPLHTTIGIKRPSPEPDDNIPTSTAKPKIVKKPKVQKKKKKKDPNEPQKPVSAYALFFRDTQAAIKGQNPNASFGEVSKIVASMWDGLDVDHKNVYKKKTEAAKKEYLKALAAYRASIVCRTGPEHDLNMPSPITRHGPQPMSMLQKKSPLLTSLMDNPSSRSQYVPQTTIGMTYNSMKPMTHSDVYASYQPPITVGYQRPDSYAQHHQNKNVMTGRITNPGGIMDGVPHATSPPVMQMEPQPPMAHAIVNNMPPNPSPQHMPAEVSSPNHFLNIQDEQYKYSYAKSWNSGGTNSNQYINTSNGSDTPNGGNYSRRVTTNGANEPGTNEYGPNRASYSNGSSQGCASTGGSGAGECYYKQQQQPITEGNMSERGMLQ